LKHYTLYNKIFKRQLKHPRNGVWLAESLEAAQKMLAACHQYLDSIGASNLKEHFIIIDANTGEIIEHSTPL